LNDASFAEVNFLLNADQELWRGKFFPVCGGKMNPDGVLAQQDF
jgi:hypothetical protein